MNISVHALIFLVYEATFVQIFQSLIVLSYEAKYVQIEKFCYKCIKIII
jgi:hypothetical protein